MKPSVTPKGWTILGPVGQDASTRCYSRVEKNGNTAILMDCSVSPPSEMHDFARLADWLNKIGVNAPDVYEEGKNYLIIEDFGDTSFKKALTKDNADELYGLAADVLARIATFQKPPVLPDYYAGNVHKGRRRVIDWYAPLIRHEKNPPGLVNEYLAAWDEIEKQLPAAPQGFVHADFHLDNLMLVPNGKGLARCGVIDFQGAMIGPLAYDLANLLEDARVDVPPAIRKKYAGNDPHLRVLATQFHCRVVGQFIKLAARDHKTGYLQYIPRTQAYIKAALEDPLLKPLKKFFADNKIGFDAPPDLKDIKSLVASDAF